MITRIRLALRTDSWHTDDYENLGELYELIHGIEIITIIR